MNFKGTKGEWYVRYMSHTGIEDKHCDMFVEAIEPKSNIGKIEIMMEDFGEHSGYPREQKLADAKLIAHAPKLLSALQDAIIGLEWHRDNDEKVNPAPFDKADDEKLLEWQELIKKIL